MYPLLTPQGLQCDDLFIQLIQLFFCLYNANFRSNTLGIKGACVLILPQLVNIVLRFEDFVSEFTTAFHIVFESIPHLVLQLLALFHWKMQAGRLLTTISVVVRYVVLLCFSDCGLIYSQI